MFGIQDNQDICDKYVHLFNKLSNNNIVNKSKEDIQNYQKQLNSFKIYLNAKLIQADLIPNQIEEIIQNFNKLRNLRIFIVDNQVLSIFEIFFQTISTHLTQLEALEIILSKDNFIQEQGARILGQALNKFQNLKKLEIQIQEQSSIGIQGLNYIIDGIDSLHKLEYLHLRIFPQNQFSNQSLDNIDQKFKNLLNLKSLIIDIYYSKLVFTQINEKENDLKENQVEGLGLAIQNLKNLQFLSYAFKLSQNPLNIGLIFKNILVHLSNLKELQLTFFYDLDIKQEQVQLISEGLKTLDKLEILYIDLTQVDRGISNMNKLLNNINCLTRLKKLTFICSQSITTFEHLQFQIFFQNSLNLTHLKIDIPIQYNSQKIQFQQFNEGMQYLKNLQCFQVSLKHNFLENESIELFSDGVSKLTGLLQLELSIDKFNFTQDPVFKLSLGIKQLLNLKIFYIKIKYGEAYDLEGARQFSNLLQCLPQLQQLEFSNQQEQSSPSMLVELGNGIKFLKELERISIVLQNFQQNNVEIGSLCEGIALLQNLKVLRILITEPNRYIQLTKALQNIPNLFCLHLFVSLHKLTEQRQHLAILSKMKSLRVFKYQTMSRLERQYLMRKAVRLIKLV